MQDTEAAGPYGRLKPVSGKPPGACAARVRKAIAGRRDLTPFQKRVLEVVARIPPGKVSTYRRVGDALGVKAYQAVGQALRANPLAPRVPCHRVIAENLGIGGYKGRLSGTAVAEKQARLAREGVLFTDGRLADPSRLVF